MKRNIVLPFHFLLCQKRAWFLQLLKRLFFCRYRFVMCGFCKSADKSCIFQYPHYGRALRNSPVAPVCIRCVRSVVSHVWLFASPWTAACQAPLSMGFSRQEYWSGLPFLSPGDLPNSGMEPESLASPALQVDSLPLYHQSELDICNSSVGLCCCKWRRVLVC